jgi:hypothetical protein
LIEQLSVASAALGVCVDELAKLHFLFLFGR